MNTKAPQKPPEGVEKPTSTADLTLPDAMNQAARDYESRMCQAIRADAESRKPQGFTVRVPLVCPHCSSYVTVLASGRTMTCQTERCPNHLKKFRLPVLYAEEVED